ncbi:MAG: Sec-independent protein translocase protein TatB [Woeseiaceae bacterium]|nr:Sec-independent protein translocase protein TatB [Woeseiaceae bacterium]
MSGVGFSELIILFVIGLIVLGPERLPRVANQLGKWIGQARRMTRVMKRQLEDELDFKEEFNIDPPARTRHSTPGAYKPPPAPAPVPEEHDETYSPMHDADSVGTGVGSDEAPVEESTEARPDDDSADRKDPA